MKLIILATALAFAAHTLGASPVTLNGPWYEFSISSNDVPAIGCGAAYCQPSARGNSVFADPPPWTFIVPAEGALLTVTDAFGRAESFNVLDFGAPIGTTPPPSASGFCKGDIFLSSDPEQCYADAFSSHGVFQLAPGPHSIAIVPHGTVGTTAAYFRIDTLQARPTGTNGLRFVPIAPCRVLDTRPGTGFDWPFGPPALAPSSIRGFPLLQGRCPIGPSARAYSLNVTVVPHGPLGYLTLWPSSQAQPFVSTLNSPRGIVVANAAIVPAGADGAVFAFATNETDLIIDVNGYFDSTPGAASFYSVAPCRVADTRFATGALGGPSLEPNQLRDFPVLAGTCTLASDAAAYSLNVTAVPDGPLGYLTLWPSGSALPFVSTLNSPLGQVIANAAILPAGDGGAVSTYATNRTGIVLDMNGYFAQPGRSGALSFYPVPPCRVADTRGSAGPLGAPVLAALTPRSFPLPHGACGLPAAAAAYSLNLTAVPEGPLGYLTIWPSGSPQPFVSTLNSNSGSLVANAAIVPAGPDGAVSVFATDPTHVVIDVNGYFAPAPALDALTTPTLLSPSDGAAFGVFPRITTVTWAPVPGATRYGVEVHYCQAGVVDCVSYRNELVNATAFTFTFVGMQPGRWRVWAIDDVTGRVSTVSPWRVFFYSV